MNFSRTIVAMITLIAAIYGQSNDPKDDIGTGDRAPDGRMKTYAGSRLAISIGIDLYVEKENFPELRLATKDASDVADLLERQGFTLRRMFYGKDQESPPADRPLTAASVWEAVRQLALVSDEADTLLIYFAGHGLTGPDGVSYLCVNTTKLDDLQNTAVSISKLVGLLDATVCPAGKRILILDACRSPGGQRGYGDRRLTLDRSKKTRGLGILSAAEDVAYEPTPGEKLHPKSNVEIVNGYFTHFLLEALNGAAESADWAVADEFVTFREAARYVQGRMKELSLRRATVQRPLLSWEGGKEGDVILVDLRNTPRTTNETMTPTPGNSAGSKDGDLTDLTVRITDPRDGTIVDSPRCTIRGRVSPQQAVKVSCNDAPATVGPDGQWQAVVELPKGKSNIVVTATREKDRVVDAVAITYAPPAAKDNVGPILTIDNAPPADAIGKVGHKIRLEGSVSDETWPVTIKVDGILASCDGDSRKWTADVLMTGGRQTITIVAADREGNNSSKSLTVVSGRLPADLTINWIHHATSSSGRKKVETALARLKEPKFAIGAIENFRDIQDKTSRYIEDAFLERMNPDRTRVILYSKGSETALPDLEKVFPRTDWEYRLRAVQSKQRERAGRNLDDTIDIFGDPK